MISRIKKPEEQYWTTFFASGCRTAREMQEDITRIRRLRDEGLELAGLAANPPQSAVFDRPDEGIGYRIGKAQKKTFDEIKVLRTKGLERRADNLPPLQTSGAWPGCFRPTTIFQTRSARGRPCDRHHSRTTNSKPRRRCATESTCLKSFTNLPLKSNNASAPGKFVDAFGSNTNKLVGA